MSLKIVYIFYVLLYLFKKNVEYECTSIILKLIIKKQIFNGLQNGYD